MAMRDKATAPRHWRPLQKLPHDQFLPSRPEVIKVMMDTYGMTSDEAVAELEKQHHECEYWVNDLYQVQAAQCGPENKITHLNIRCRDGSTDIRDWRHFQQIKNEICGNEREGFELYPMESRKVDTSNKFHIWVLPLGQSFDAIGWLKRDVQYEENKNVPGLRQRSL